MTNKEHIEYLKMERTLLKIKCDVKDLMIVKLQKEVEELKNPRMPDNAPVKDSKNAIMELEV